MSIQEKHLRRSRLENLQRWAKWLGVEPRIGKNDKESLTFLIYGILRAVKHLERLPKGTIPSDLAAGRKQKCQNL